MNASKPDSPAPVRDTVVIGASAGGMQALRTIVSELPSVFPAAILIVLHIGNHQSALAAILRASGRLPVIEPRDGEAVRAGHIYVALPDRHMLLEYDRIRLSRGPRENHTRPAIDPLFRSAALTRGPRVVGALLTGRLDDGVVGLQAIKECGGLAVVQDPASAEEPSMPANALRSVVVDRVAPLGTLAANVVVTAVMMLWLLDHPAVEQSLLSPEQIDQLVAHDFEDYYSEYAASHFAAQVWVNNAWVAGLCLALGVLGVPVVYLLFQNIANLAIIGSIMIRHDHGAHFWGLILPHGLLELTAVFVAGGVGLRLFWSWVEPGSLTRAQSLAREGRTAGTVALGLVAVLFVSGVIEAFVTPSGLPTWARLAIGILSEAVFLSYVFVVGREAVRRGHTGDLDAALLEDRVTSEAERWVRFPRFTGDVGTSGPKFRPNCSGFPGEPGKPSTSAAPIRAARAP